MADDDFATVAEYEAMVGPATSRTLLDLEAASQTIRDFCQWHIYPLRGADEVIVQRPGGSRVLMLPTAKLVDVVSVSETARGADAEPVELDVADLEWDESGVIERSGCWTARSRGVTVVIDHGFADVPASIRQVCVDLAARAAASPKGSIRSQVGQRSESWAVGSGQAPAGGSLLQSEKEKLASYVRVR